MKKIKEWLGLIEYTSEIDQFIKKLNENDHILSESQYTEREKFKRIYQLRDKTMMEENKKIFWENF